MCQDLTTWQPYWIPCKFLFCKNQCLHLRVRSYLNQLCLEAALTEPDKVVCQVWSSLIRNRKCSEVREMCSESLWWPRFLVHEWLLSVWSTRMIAFITTSYIDQCMTFWVLVKSYTISPEYEVVLTTQFQLFKGLFEDWASKWYSFSNGLVVKG